MVIGCLILCDSEQEIKDSGRWQVEDENSNQREATTVPFGDTQHSHIMCVISLKKISKKLNIVSQRQYDIKPATSI